jgi:hypothetical protein
MLADDQTWAVRYLIVDTHRWRSGRRDTGLDEHPPEAIVSTCNF